MMVLYYSRVSDISQSTPDGFITTTHSIFSLFSLYFSLVITCRNFCLLTTSIDSKNPNNFITSYNPKCIVHSKFPIHTLGSYYEQFAAQLSYHHEYVCCSTRMWMTAMKRWVFKISTCLQWNVRINKLLVRQMQIAST